jgi:Zn-finger nucleic acid-binding protein
MESDYETSKSKLDIGISLRCQTPNCKAIVCNGCEVKLQEQLGYNSVEIIKCPLCRQQYLKNHLTWVVLKVDFKEKIEEKKINLKSRIKYLQKELDECIETLKSYD